MSREDMETPEAAMQCNATSGISMIPLDIVSFKYGRVSRTDKIQIQIQIQTLVNV